MQLVIETGDWQRLSSSAREELIGLLGAGYYLLSDGEPHGQTDQIGVLVTIANLFVFSYALRGWHKAG